MSWHEEREQLLRARISDLGLRIEASPLEPLIAELYRELDANGLELKPPIYLSDEWGCPEGVPVIGVPFYLANPNLSRIESEIEENLETPEESMMYLRHEAGHAFNYAYKLYEHEEWAKCFGPYSRPYIENYKPNPFSREFVRHIAGWYAQKHPDEDFAETFAVWLTPRSNWRVKYKGWGAMAKLRYVDRMARKFGDTEPIRPQGSTDLTVEEMETTVEDFYRKALEEQQSTVELALDTDLADIFKVSRRRKKGVRPAAELVNENRKAIVDKVAYWTGVQRPVVKKLVESIAARVGEMGLRADVKTEKDHLTEVSVYATALAMNYLARGKFVQS